MNNVISDWREFEMFSKLLKKAKGTPTDKEKPSPKKETPSKDDSSVDKRPSKKSNLC